MFATALLIATPVCAQESIGPEVPAAAVEEKEAGDNYEACAAFRADIDADLREVLKAGCGCRLRKADAEKLGIIPSVPLISLKKPIP